MNIRSDISSFPSPESVVAEQLNAYNARDLERWLLSYAPDAEQYILHGGILAAGRDAMRERMRARFADPALHADLLSRTVMEQIVIDHEVVTRTSSDNVVKVEMLCIYEVRGGLIVKATFAFGAERPVVTKN